MKKVLLLAMVAVLSACASQSQLYVNASRHTVRCAAAGMGISGIIVSGITMSNCDTDYRAMGYLPLEQAGASGLNFGKAEDPPVITRVFPGSPAANAGIMVGDTIASVNGEKAVNSGEAIKMLFGAVGAQKTVVIVSKPPRTANLTLVSYAGLYGTQAPVPQSASGTPAGR